MRHYTVFLSEDSSDDEFQQEEDPVSGFSENFFFSAPFEWSMLYSFDVLSQSLNSGFGIGQGACCCTWDFGNAPALCVAPDECSAFLLLVCFGIQRHAKAYSCMKHYAAVHCLWFYTSSSSVGCDPSTCPLFQCAACVPLQTSRHPSLCSAGCSSWHCPVSLIPVRLPAFCSFTCLIPVSVLSGTTSSVTMGSCHADVPKGSDYNLT